LQADQHLPPGTMYKIFGSLWLFKYKFSNYHYLNVNYRDLKIR